MKDAMRARMSNEHAETRIRRRVVIVGVAVWALLTTSPALGARSGRADCEAFVAGVRAGTPTHMLPTPAAGWDNDRVIDAWIEAIALGDRPGERPAYAAAFRLARHEGLLRSDEPQGSRALDVTLPSRIEPVLLDMLRRAAPLRPTATRPPAGAGQPARIRGLRAPVILALGSIDAPGSDAIAAVLEALNNEEAETVESAVEAAGMLGHHAAGATADLERLLESTPPGRPTSFVAMRRQDKRVEIAGALARVSDGPHALALDTLVESARSEGPASAERALGHLRDIGPRGRPAVDGPMAILDDAGLDRPAVAPAIAAVAPDLLPALVERLLARSASDDRAAAWRAEKELFALSRRWGASPEMRAIVPALIATLETRAAADGLALSKTLREIDSPLAGEAYGAYLRRERRERGATGELKPPRRRWFADTVDLIGRGAEAAQRSKTEAAGQTDDE